VGVDCHNNQTTPADAGVVRRGGDQLHAVPHGGRRVSGEFANPTLGLHDNNPLPTVSKVAHDDSFATSGVCTTCHVAVPAVGPNASAAHINGALTADDALTTTNEYYVLAAYTDASGNGGACAGPVRPRAA